MRKSMLLVILLHLVAYSYAQQSLVKGQILGSDSLSIPGVAVIMQTMDSVYINAGVSDMDGYFRIESSVRPYRLLIQHIAYKPLSIESSDNNVGTVFLEEMVNELAGIIVKAERPIMKVDNGKLSYDLKSITQNKIIDNAFDLVKELPSIISDGSSISIIGAMGGTDILISEKKSNMSFEQLLEYLRTLPADQVERIEIVYNPPPAWHVTGSAINVVLKKENKYNLQGQMQGRYTNQSANSYMLGGSLFLSSPNVSFDLIYNYNDARSKSRNLQYAIHTLDDQIYHIQTDLLDKNQENYHNLYTSLKYDFADKSNLDISYVGKFSPKDDKDATSINNYFSDANTQAKNNSYLHDISLTYTTSFGLKTGAEYTRFRSDGLQNMQYIRKEMAVDAFVYDIGQRINRANIFADMTHTLPQDWKLSYGAKYAYTDNTNTQMYEDKENNGKDSYDQSSVTKEHIANVYVGLNKSFFNGKLNGNASLTGELYKINAYKKNTLLPYASLTYTPTTKHSVQLAYRMLYLYPSYWQRQEYAIQSDEYTIEIGNPMLRPSRYSIVNLLYVLNSKYMFQTSYYRINDYAIAQSYQSPDKLQLINKTVNTDFTSSLAFTLMVPVRFGEVLSTNLTASLSNDRFKSNDWFDLSYDRNKWAGLIVLNNTLTLLKAPLITLNVNASYKTPTIQGIWDLDEMWGIGAGVKWEIIKGKAILNFQCNDIFESSYPMIKARYEKQYLDMDYRYFRRNFMVSFSYSFKGYKEKRAKSVDTSRYGL